MLVYNIFLATYMQRLRNFANFVYIYLLIDDVDIYSQCSSPSATKTGKLGAFFCYKSEKKLACMKLDRGACTYFTSNSMMYNLLHKFANFGNKKMGIFFFQP